MAKEANSGRKVVVKFDTSTKEKISKCVCRLSENCSDELTNDFNSESEASLDILVNMVPIFPEEYNRVTEVKESEEADTEDVTLY